MPWLPSLLPRFLLRFSHQIFFFLPLGRVDSLSFRIRAEQQQLPEEVINDRGPQLQILRLEILPHVLHGKVRFEPILDSRHVAPPSQKVIPPLRCFGGVRLAVRECPRFRGQVSRRVPLRHTFLRREAGKAKRKRKGGSGTDYAIRTHWAAKRTRDAATTTKAKSMCHLPGFGYFERAPCRRGGPAPLCRV